MLFRSVDEGRQCQPQPLYQHIDAVEPVKLMGCQAHGVHADVYKRQLVRKGREVLTTKSTAPALQKTYNSQKKQYSDRCV